MFQLVAAHPALDFVNTMDWRFRPSGPEELLETYDDLVRFTEQSQLLSPEHAQHLLTTVSNRKGATALVCAKELREAISDILYAALSGQSIAPSQVQTLERHFRNARQQQKLQWIGSHLQWSWTEAQDEPELPLWLLAQSASSLLTSEFLSKLRACDNAECQWLFLDTSKNHSKRWCDMRVCGNRMKARRFKAQRAS
jgi:predicted RNA-binding Zn ribbon-like protein